MTEATQRRSLSAIDEALRAQAIELPSWAFGNSGTRFKVFSQKGIPRDPFEKIADAAMVHRVTGVAPSVALHIPWDAVDDYEALAKHAAAYPDVLVTSAHEGSGIAELRAAIARLLAERKSKR